LKLVRYIYFLLCGFCLSVNLSAQILINEFSAANASKLVDENGKFGDWIELYNAGNAAVNIANFSLSDSPTEPNKWRFPSISIPANGFLTVIADDTSKLTFVDHWETAVHANDNWAYHVPTAASDTNWRNLSFNDASWLTGKGGFGYGDGDDSTILSNIRAVYLRKKFSIADTLEVVKAIFNIDYDDGFVAYLNGVEIARNNIGVVGLRPNYNAYAINDKEAEMYKGNDPDSFYVNLNLLRAALQNGDNVLAVEVHNNSDFSTDLSAIPFFTIGVERSNYVYPQPPSWFVSSPREFLHANFKLSKSGETIVLSDSMGNILDQKFTGLMEVDVSYGRSPDGSLNWCHFSPPSPNFSNNASFCYTGFSSIPTFSLNGGQYTTSQILNLNASPFGAIIRYTTDGSTPNDSSPIYSTSIVLDSTQIIRARAFTPGKVPSFVVSNTYFINENTHLSVFSLSTNPENLWDDSTGIYVLGNNASSSYPYKGANYWMDWERPVSVEYFDKQKNKVFQFDAGIKINGNYSRTKPQKSFEVALDNDYGITEITYPLIPEKQNIKTYDSFVLRNAGTDWNVVHYRDALMQRIMRNTNTGYLGYEPCNMFLNGEYWGVYEIRTNDNHTYVERNFGLKKSEFDLIYEGRDLEIKNGSDTGFYNMYNYAMTANPVDSAFYRSMDAKFDLKNYTDYFIAETYFVNNDWIGEWTNNVKLWRPRASGGKWQYILYDLDFGMGLYSSQYTDKLAELITPEDGNYQSDIFNRMISNPIFRRDFINRYADLVNTIYVPKNVNNLAYQMRDSIAQDMPLQFARWGGSMTNWAQNISTLINFSNTRPTRALNFVQSNFNLSNKVVLTLDAYPLGAGRIQISTIVPDSLPWKGTYFNGNPVTLTAIPNPGYSFEYWKPNNVLLVADSNQSITLNFTSNDSVVAYFSGSPITPHITFNEINYQSADSADAGDWLEFHNLDSVAIDLSSWKFKDNDDLHSFTFPLGTKIEANDYLVLAEDFVKFSSQFVYSDVHKHLHVQSNPLPTPLGSKINLGPKVIGPFAFGFTNTGELLRLYDYKDSLHISMSYSKLPPWPLDAAGGGFTLESIDNNPDLENGANWFSGCKGGSPGLRFSPTEVNLIADSSLTICSGDTLVLNAQYNSNYDYFWLKNDTTLPNQNSASLAITDSGSYSVFVKQLNCEASSHKVQVKILEAPIANIYAAASSYYCEGSSIILRADSSSGQTYEWLKNDTLIVSNNPAFLVVVDSGLYKVRTSKNGCIRTSLPINVLQQTIPDASLQQDSSYVICSGYSQELYAPSHYGYTYFWYKNDTLILGADSSTYAATESGAYNFVSLKNGCSNSSQDIVLTVNTAPFTFINPTDTLVLCDGEQQFLYAYSDTNYMYQWFKNDTLIAGADSASLQVDLPGIYKITTQNTNCTSTAELVLQVKPSPVAFINADSLIRICKGIGHQLKVNPSLGYAYQWYKNDTALQGENLNKYSASADGFYSVRINLNSCSSLSNAIQIQVNNLPENSIYALDTNVFCEGNSLDIFSFANPDLSYQWYRNGILFAVPNDTVLKATQSGNYYLLQRDSLCTSLSNSLEVIVHALPQNTVFANASTHLCAGSSVILQTNFAADYNYFWYKNAAPIFNSDSNLISVSDSGAYFVKVSNANCDVNSDTLFVTQNKQLQATILAIDTALVCAGTGFIYKASTQQNLSYQWYHNSMAIPFAADSMYAAVLPGSYFVEVSDSSCSEVSLKKVLENYIPTNVSLTSFYPKCLYDGAFELSGGLPYGGTYSGNGIDTGYFAPSVAGVGINYVYYQFTDANNCTATATSEIEVYGQVPTPVITQNFNVLQSSALSGNQWYFNDTLLPGATNQIYVPTQNGWYSVIVADNVLCYSLPTYYSFISLGIKQSGKNYFSVYPNPANSNVTVTFPSTVTGERRLQILDLLGQEIYLHVTKARGENEVKLNLSGIKAGIYLIRVSSESGVFEEKLLIY
jgi:hypothetical protein